MIASRVRDEVDSSSLGQTRKPGSELGHNNTNLKTVAVLPVSRNVPIEAFARKLQTALEGMGASTSYLNQTIITKHLGRHAFTRMGKLKVRNLLIVCVCLLSYYSIPQSAGWLTDQEQRFHLVLYVVDSPVNSPWTQTCIRQVRPRSAFEQLKFLMLLIGGLRHGRRNGRRSNNRRIRATPFVNEDHGSQRAYSSPLRSFSYPWDHSRMAQGLRNIPFIVFV